MEMQRPNYVFFLFQRLVKATQKGDIDDVERLIREGADINYTDHYSVCINL